MSGGHLCEAEAPTEAAAETVSDAAIRRLKRITDCHADKSAHNDKTFIIII